MKPASYLNQPASDPLHQIAGAVITPGVAALGHDTVNRIVKAIAVFDEFCTAHDPEGDHHSGTFDVDGQLIAFRSTISRPAPAAGRRSLQIRRSPTASSPSRWSGSACSQSEVTDRLTAQTCRPAGTGQQEGHSIGCLQPPPTMAQRTSIRAGTGAAAGTLGTACQAA